MKRSHYLIPTLKEKPNDIEQVSQVLMFRAGMLKKVQNGFFMYLPLMQRSLKKVSDVIRKHMEAADSSECKFPILVSKETLEASGRWNAFGKEMFKLSDRSENEFAISPTNEEAACFAAECFVRSYKDLPFSVYQIQQKHRDEISPRNGVMRAREFMMKDAYSFHADEACLDAYYNRVHKAYLAIFNELGLDVVAVSADTGAMGGSGSQEIMAVSPDGETDICRCGSCGFAANAETVPCVAEGSGVRGQGSGNADEIKSFIPSPESRTPSPEKKHTPNARTIDELVRFFGKQTKDFLKSVIFNADGELVVAMVRGDREVNDVKLKKILDAKTLEMATAAEIGKTQKTVVGFVGPVGLKGFKIIADYEVAAMRDFIAGANEKDYHLTCVNPSDFTAQYADLRFATTGEKCPACGAELQFAKATELGHIFKLGKRYTDKLDLKFTAKSGDLQTLTMGCYGIGVERTVASVVDQHHDDKGIIWPVNVAPFTVDLITVDTTNAEQMRVSEKLYTALQKKGIEVLWDDTDARPGSKFADCELIGFPLRLVVGRGVVNGKVELVDRASGEKTEVEVADCVKAAATKLRSPAKK
ncbi:MAG: proline--tRNA ligase [Firmicutes bacterium]|nr:proline--tRNA ligase [Bacillota bacterium]